MAKDFEKTSEQLEISDEMSYLTKGTSMRPLFREHRDVVTVSKVFRELRRGDVVLYPSKNSSDLVLHRILKVKGNDLIIRGDNNLFLEHRKKAEIVGVMVSFFRKGKYCDCKTNKLYKIYTTWTLNTYFLRWFWVKVIRRILSKTAKAVLRLFGINYKKK